MSRCCRRRQTTTVTQPIVVPQSNNCICSLPTLVILILVVLQFSRNKVGCGDGDDGGYGMGLRDNQVGNGILFIIALFFLSCAGCGRGGYGAY